MALRLLHTSDWHLGHTLKDLDRSHEHQGFLDWLLKTLEAERVDALVVAGDVFDVSNPPAAATAMFYRFLAEAHRRLPALDVVVTGGNHDSAARLDAPTPLLRAMERISVLGGVPREEGRRHPERMLLPLHGKDGAVAAWLAAVPFLRAADLPLDIGELVAGARQVYLEVLEAARARRRPGQALIASGHCFMVDGRVSAESERAIFGGNQHALPDDLFPADITYVALGHLHLAQPVAGRVAVRYSGSPLPLSFTERAYRHAVCLVDFDGDRLVEVRQLPVPRLVDFLVVPEEPLPLAEVVERLRALPAADGEDRAFWPYLEVKVALARPEPGLRKQVEDALAGRRARLVKLTPHRAGDGAALADGSPAEALPDLSEEEVLRRCWRSRHGGEPPPEIAAAFAELVSLCAEVAR